MQRRQGHDRRRAAKRDAADQSERGELGHRDGEAIASQRLRSKRDGCSHESADPSIGRGQRLPLVRSTIAIGSDAAADDDDRDAA
jgi:hypothetical protein